MASAASETTDFLVDRSDLRRCTTKHGPSPDDVALAPGQLLLGIDAFALTANNVTYAVFGDAMAYWQFFPSEGEWGRVPVWGFADVVRSRHDAVPDGERVYGYFPMSTHLVVQADRVTDASFVDASPHRQPLPPVYNQYTRVAHDPSYERPHENLQMLFRPLFTTAFLLDDLLADRDFFSAGTVLLGSASSKTALALAFLLSRNRRSRCRVVGLTSPAHARFAERVGVYDRVVPYGEIGSLPADAPAVLVDMAGSGQVLAAVHEHFRERLKSSCLVGATHWEAPRPSEALPGPKPEFFFAPDRVRQRTRDWGAEGFQARVGASWREFVPAAESWVTVVRRSGAAAVEEAYRDVLDGRATPDRGYVLSL
ncbi:MAG TPA: DUF2855 family protein [Candidatus Binatus sp.]|nr:DUF2855 family protein [Candidatus Binatus sp.]